MTLVLPAYNKLIGGERRLSLNTLTYESGQQKFNNQLQNVAFGISFPPNGEWYYACQASSRLRCWDLRAGNEFDTTQVHLAEDVNLFGLNESDAITNEAGDRGWLFRANSNQIAEYTCSGFEFTLTAITSFNTTRPQTGDWNDDGTSILFYDNISGEVEVADCATAYGLATASLNGAKTFDINQSIIDDATNLSSTLTDCCGLSFTGDGKNMFYACRGSGYIGHWEMSTPWDPSTASFVSERDLATDTGNTPLFGAKVTRDGTYIIGGAGSSTTSHAERWVF